MLEKTFSQTHKLKNYNLIIFFKIYSSTNTEYFIYILFGDYTRSFC